MFSVFDIYRSIFGKEMWCKILKNATLERLELYSEF